MKKDFDAVKLRRDIREKLGREYENDIELKRHHLEAIHKKYGLAPRTKKYAYL